MTGKLAVACLVLAMTCRAAVAAPVDECVLLSPSVVILRACTEVIESPNFGSDQKALAYKYRAVVRMSAGAVQSPLLTTRSIRLKRKMLSLSQAGDGRNSLTEIWLDRSPIIAKRFAFPPSATLYAERGHVNIVAGKADDAIRDLNEALRLDPKNADAFNTRGFAYAKKGDLVRAQEDYNAAIKLNPLGAVYYANRGYVYEAQKRKKDAIDEFKQALRLDPS